MKKIILLICALCDVAIHAKNKTNKPLPKHALQGTQALGEVKIRKHYYAPKTISFIRHAEKLQAVDACGCPIFEEKKGKKTPKWTIHLNTRGFERAAALAPFFTKDPSMTQFSKPVAIFASYAPGGSVRPIDTIKPTADAFGLTVQTVPADNYPDLIDYIFSTKEFTGQHILICFEHNHIPPMVNAFIGQQGKNLKIKTPQSWDNNDFSHVWVLHFDQDHQGSLERPVATDFAIYPQYLLSGDPKK